MLADVGRARGMRTARRWPLVAASAALVGLLGLLLVVVLPRHGEDRHYSGFLVVWDADSSQRAITPSTRRLRVQFDTGGSCDKRVPVARVVATRSAHSIRLNASYRPLPRPKGGFCAGVGTFASITVPLPRPLGGQRLFNPHGRIDKVYVRDRTVELATAPGHNLLAARPAVFYRIRRDLQTEILVVGRTLRPRRPHLEVQLDESPLRSSAEPSRHGRCFVSRLLPTRVFRQQPQLYLAGRHQEISVVLRDGERYEGLQTARPHIDTFDTGDVRAALARRGCA